MEEIQGGNCQTVFFLTPDSTDTKTWWHKYIAEHSPCTLFFEGRINYIDPETGKQETGVSFGSALSVLGEVPESFLEWAEGRGDLVWRTK